MDAYGRNATSSFEARYYNRRSVLNAPGDDGQRLLSSSDQTLGREQAAART